MIKGLFSILVLFAVIYSGEIPEKVLYPGTQDTSSYQETLNLEKALYAFAMCDSMLKELAGVVSSRRTIECNKQMAAIENKFHESLTIGVMNFPKIIKGTLLAQNYKITKLEYENSRLMKEKPDIIAHNKENYDTAKAIFLDYWNKMALSD